MSITDILIITMKRDLDGPLAKLLSFCYENSKKRFGNNQMKIILVLNQNNTNDLTMNRSEINKLKKEINLNHEVQLSMAFKNNPLNSSHLPFLPEKINFVKFTP